MSEVEATTLADRLAAISSKLVTLRDQTSALALRVEGAASRSRAVRTDQRVACSHGKQVEQMQGALDAVEHELEGLRTAMLTRGVIEQAKGMLMLHRQCDADAAFGTLVELSQKSHRKLVEVAEHMVREWSTGRHGPA